jgi:hypothetical protein
VLIINIYTHKRECENIMFIFMISRETLGSRGTPVEKGDLGYQFGLVCAKTLENPQQESQSHRKNTPMLPRRINTEPYIHYFHTVLSTSQIKFPSCEFFLERILFLPINPHTLIVTPCWSGNHNGTSAVQAGISCGRSISYVKIDLLFPTGDG